MSEGMSASLRAHSMVLKGVRQGNPPEDIRRQRLFVGWRRHSRMAHLLDHYARPCDPDEPVICFDVDSAQLLGRVLVPLPFQPGRAAL